MGSLSDLSPTHFLLGDCSTHREEAQTQDVSLQPTASPSVLCLQTSLSRDLPSLSSAEVLPSSLLLLQ